MQISKDEASAALASARQAQAAARAAFRAHYGHYHLWLWGVLWIVMALNVHVRGMAGVRLLPWISLGGAIGSFLIGALQSRQLRHPVDPRLVRVLAALLGFAVAVPFVFAVQLVAPERLFTYCVLVIAQCYVVAGLWFDTYLTWCGLLLAGLVLAGLFVFPGIFWLWFAVCCGGTLLGTGFYIRYFWR